MKKPYPSSEPGLIPDNAEDADGDASASPERQCAVTRERLAREAMLRFVLSPDGVVTPDIAARLPGRGVWVTAERRHVDTAAAKGAFARGFKSAVTVPDGLSDLVERLLLKRCIDLLGLARKAGLAVTGRRFLVSTTTCLERPWLKLCFTVPEVFRTTVSGLRPPELS